MPLAEASTNDGSFNLNLAHLTGAWNDGSQVEVRGFVCGTLTYGTTYAVNAAGPTPINFHHLGVDEVILSLLAAHRSPL